MRDITTIVSLRHCTPPNMPQHITRGYIASAPRTVLTSLARVRTAGTGQYPLEGTVWGTSRCRLMIFYKLFYVVHPVPYGEHRVHVLQQFGIVAAASSQQQGFFEERLPCPW